MVDDAPAVLSSGLSRGRRALVIGCVSVNAMTAGSLFCFPLIGPSLMADFALDLKQTNTLWAAAVLGEYLSAAGWGALADVYGPAPLSLAACILFSVGYGLMAQRSLPLPSALDVQPAAFAPFGFGPTVWLGACFAMIGAGVGASYFGSMTAATRVWPEHPGRALALPLTLFSLSSMLLTALGEQFFVDRNSGNLDAGRYLAFLAILLGVCNALGAYGFRCTPPVDDTQAKQAHGQGVRHEQHQARSRAAAEQARASASTTALAANERTPLVHHEHHHHYRVDPVPSLDESPEVAFVAPRGLPNDLAVIEAGDEQATASGWSVRSSTSMLTPRSESLKDFVTAPSVWILALVLVTAVGAGEMIMSSVGAMVAALYPMQDLTDVPGLARDELRWRSRAIALLSVTNTVSRFMAGFVADALSPARQLDDDVEESAPSSGWWERTKAYLNNLRMSRVTLLMVGTGTQALAFGYAALGLSTLRGLMVLACVTGFLYGSTFTLVPSIVASAFGLSTFGRSWGLLSYACALGSFGFAMIYAAISDSVAERPLVLGWTLRAEEGGPTICRAGRACFSLSFTLAAVTTAAATALLAILRVRWYKYL